LKSSSSNATDNNGSAIVKPCAEDAKETDSAGKGNTTKKKAGFETYTPNDFDQIKELNRLLIEKRADISIAEYIEEVKKMIHVDAQFISDFIMLVERDDCCVDSDFLKVYSVQSKESSSDHSLMLLKKVNLVEGRDEIRIEPTVTKKKFKYFLTPMLFKKLLIRSKNTDVFTDYYLALEKCVYHYQVFQVELKNKKIETMVSKLLIK
jgi:hypothetical protein